MQAFNGLVLAHPEKAGNYTEADLEPFLAMSYAPEPDLFIRTGGEQRISNFLLWQLAYCELFFTDKFWPDFDTATLDAAIMSYRRRERRFGRTSDQLIAGLGRPEAPANAVSPAPTLLAPHARKPGSLPPTPRGGNPASAWDGPAPTFPAETNDA